MRTEHDSSQSTDFLDTFFSLEPYKNTSEAMAVIGASLLAAITVPVLIAIFEPLLIIATLAALFLSFISSIAYICHDLNHDEQHLSNYKDYYKNLHRITMALLCITIFPPILWSIILVGVALWRGIASCFVDSQGPAIDEHMEVETYHQHVHVRQ